MKKLRILQLLSMDRKRSTTAIANSALSLRWTLRCAEWALLLMTVLLYAVDWSSYVTDALLPKVIALDIALFLLSLSFPVDRPPWQRRAYVALEIFIIVVAQASDIDFSILLYFFLIKSCFLLSRREVLFTVTIAGVGYLSSLAWSLPGRIQETLEQIRSRNLGYSYGASILFPPLFVQYLVEYLGISVFVILVGFVIIAERKSRQRAEALAREVQTLVATLERTRIARDIHDSLGHTLTTLGVQLEVAQKLRQRNPKHALQAVDTAKLLADQCLTDVRRALQTMRQPDFNFDQALTTLLEQVKHSQSFTIATQVNLPALPLETSQQLYSLVQEGLTNIQKHACASHVRLRLWATPGSIHLLLKDDGQGFDTKQAYSGFGLRGMKERTQILGGELKITSVLGKGTQIQVTIPQ